MQTIVFIGCNKSGTSRDALTAAKELGYYVILLTDREKFLMQKNDFPEVDKIIYLLNILDKQILVDILRKIEEDGKKIKACLSLIDPFVSLAAEVAQEWGLTSLSIQALKIMEEKTKVREILSDLSSSPFFAIYQNQVRIKKFVDSFSDLFPLIVKSSFSNGSKDVLLVENKKKLISSIKLLQKKKPQLPILVEEYLEGEQFIVEVIMNNGCLTIVSVIEQEILHQKGRFIVTGYGLPALLSQLERDQLEHAVKEIVYRLGLEHGNCHLEVRNTNKGWKLIEINPRVSGGAMNRMILEATGINYVSEIIKLHLGSLPFITPTKQTFVFTKFLTVASRGRLIKVTGKHRALKHAGIKDVYIKPKKGTILSPPDSLANRYAYVLAVADSREEAKETAIRAAKEIKFYLESTEGVEQ